MFLHVCYLCNFVSITTYKEQHEKYCNSRNATKLHTLVINICNARLFAMLELMDCSLQRVNIWLLLSVKYQIGILNYCTELDRRIALHS